MDRIPLEVQGGEEDQIRFRDCFSVRYLQAAAVLCRLAYGIEHPAGEAGEAGTTTGEPAGAGEGGESGEEPVLRHEAFVLNAILSSVAFLESAVNELYADAADDAYFCADARTGEILKAIAGMWHNEKNFDRAPVITRYQKILAIAGAEPFDPADQAFANVRELIAIRNNLMHYRREWIVIPDDEAHPAGTPARAGTSERFEKILKKKFAPNPFAGKNRPFFPDRCLGHGCAEWAVLNSVIFADAFFRRLGLPVPYEGIRDELKTR